VAAPEDLWLRLDALPRELRVEGEVVVVRGAVRLEALCAALEEAGRMLPNLGTITAQTVVGATATGTHGTGLRLPGLAAGVRGMRLVDGRGALRVWGEGDPELATGAVHLGALGVVTELRLGTVPARRLRERLWSVSLEAALDGLGGWLEAHQHLRLWWLPHAGRVQVYAADQSDEADTGPNALAVRLDRWGVQQPVFACLLALARLAPGLVPAIHRFAQASSFPDRSRVESQRHVLTMPVPPRHDEVEVCIPREQAGPALQEWWERVHRLPASPDFVQELRFTAADAIALSPSSGRASAWLGAYCANPRTARAYFAEFLAMARGWGARPHWGKRFDHRAPELAALYPRWEEFQALRRACDPEGVFRSPFLERVLGA
jgi:L-gulono-1,4-lactone dehydrogenase